MSKKVEETPKSKVYFRFAIIMILAMVVGALTGLFAALADFYFEDFSGVKGAMLFVIPALTLIANIVIFAMTLAGYLRNKREYVNRDPMDEDILDVIEKRLSYPACYCAISMVATYFFFPINIWLAETVELSIGDFNVSAFVGVFGAAMLFVGLAWTMTMQRKIVNLIKELNPQLKGDVLEKDFRKKWLATMDEAQKYTTYKSAYSSHIATQYACIVTWAIAIIGMISFNTGILPCICVSIIFFVCTLSYSIAAIKNGK